MVQSLFTDGGAESVTADQATELFLKGTEFEVESIELMDNRPSTDWIIPPFLRIKGDLQFLGM